VAFAADADAVVDCLERHVGPMERVDDPDPGGAVSVLDRYFAGEVAAIDELQLDPIGTEFQRSVWRALRAVPVGETTSYGEIAAEIGAPGAVRAVGSANGANPIVVIVPCHRVVRSDGSLGGYGGGLDRKRWLLAHEDAGTASLWSPAPVEESSSAISR
jgi:methylated-DNA-[protein]-cysteine S-methyltransferase